VAWIEEIQRELGGPVVAFALQHWIFLLVAGALAVLWLFGSLSDRAGAGGILWFGGSDGDSDDGGGGDGGGGGD
jgi:uncharacterized membrane protein YgcG